MVLFFSKGLLCLRCCKDTIERPQMEQEARLETSAAFQRHVSGGREMGGSSQILGSFGEFEHGGKGGCMMACGVKHPKFGLSNSMG